MPFKNRKPKTTRERKPVHLKPSPAQTSRTTPAQPRACLRSSTASRSRSSGPLCSERKTRSPYRQKTTQNIKDKKKEPVSGRGEQIENRSTKPTQRRATEKTVRFPPEGIANQGTPSKKSRVLPMKQEYPPKNTPIGKCNYIASLQCNTLPALHSARRHHACPLEGWSFSVAVDESEKKNTTC